MFAYCKPHLWLFEANRKFTLLEAAPWTKNGIRKNLSPRRCLELENDMSSIQCPLHPWQTLSSSIIPSYDVSLGNLYYILFLLHLRHCRYISLQICLWRYSAFSPRAPAAALDTGVFLTYFWTQKSAVRSSYLLKVHGALGSKHSCDLWRFLTYVHRNVEKRVSEACRSM